MKTKNVVYLVDKVIRKSGDIISTGEFRNLPAAKKYAKAIKNRMYGYRISEFKTVKTAVKEEI